MPVENDPRAVLMVCYSGTINKNYSNSSFVGGLCVIKPFAI